ncbi:MAG: hypothetical protein WCK59_01820 [Candidatus Falkowbacteria bacterium]
MIIFINGSINSGKSTVAKLVADSLGNTALLEIDSLREFISWLPIKQAIPLNLINAVSVINNFLKNKIDVIVPYPLSQANYDFFLQELKDYQSSIFAFTLSPKLEVALSNRGTRNLDEAEKERIKYHYSIGIPKPDFGIILDNSLETPEVTAAKILKIINP